MPSPRDAQAERREGAGAATAGLVCGPPGPWPPFVQPQLRMSFTFSKGRVRRTATKRTGRRLKAFATSIFRKEPDDPRQHPTTREDEKLTVKPKGTLPKGSVG